MTIVDARALQYEQMIAVKNKQPINLLSTEKLKEYDSIRVISILDPNLDRIFENDIENKIITLVFHDAEPTAIENNKDLDFEPPPEHLYMTKQQAGKILDFIEDAQNSQEKILLLVNCKYGMCRSGAVVDFVGNICNLGYWNTKNSNPQIVPNHWVQYLLFQEYFKRKFSVKL